MAGITKEQVLASLSALAAPDGSGNIVARGLLSDIFISGGKVMFSITVPAERAAEYEATRKDAERLVREIPGVDGVIAALTAEKKAGSGRGPVPPPRAAVAASPTAHAHRP